MEDSKYFLIILFFASFISISSTTSISFTESGEGYTVSDNIVTITGSGPFDLTGWQTNAKIIVSSSCTLNLDAFSIINTGQLTPLIISENKEVELVLTGESSFMDSNSNENDGTIYLQAGASLKIKGEGTLNIVPNKYMAINGTDDTSLVVNDNAHITIYSESATIGGIYLKKEIIFNNAQYTYNCENGAHHAIDSEGPIKLIKGQFIIKSGNGKGIQSEKYLQIGEEGGDNEDLILSITSNNEGIEAMGIIIYSGIIEITSGQDGINAASSGNECDESIQCSGNCECFIKIYDGLLQIQSEEDGLDSNGDITITGGQIIIFAASQGANQPIDQDGLLSITGGVIIAAGSNSMGVKAETTQVQKTYKGTISEGTQLKILDEYGSEIFEDKTPKEANYIYFNYKSSFTVELNNAEITLTDQENNNPDRPGDMGGKRPGEKNEENYSSRYFLRVFNIMLIIGIIL